MRLAVFGPGHPFRGGIAQATTRLVEALRDHGHETYFMAADRQYPRWLFPGADDRDPAACAPLAGTERRLSPLEPWRWPAVRRRAMELAADAWIVPYWTWAWGFWWWWLLRTRRRPPVVAIVHNPADHDSDLVQRLVSRRVLARCDALFTHGEALRAQLARSFPATPTAAHLLPPVVEAGPLASASRSPGGRRTALFVGIIRPYKGVDLLLEAMARPEVSARWRLVVAGEPWGRLGEELAARVEDLGLTDRVELRLGWVAEAELDALFAAADLVVLPYRAGTQSAVAPRALAAGRPVLTTKVGGLPELVGSGSQAAGQVVEPGSAEALATALAELDDGELARLAALAPSRVPTWHGYVERLEELIRPVRG